MKNLIFTILAFSTIAMFSCQNAPKGEKAVTGAAQKVASAAAAKNYNVDSAASKIGWTGSKLAGKHMGTLDVNAGTVQVKDGKVVGGSFNINMNSLTCTDLKAGEGKEDLEGHLKNEDFFDTAKFPNSTFSITKVEGGNVTGNLKIKDITKSISFPATISVTDAGVAVSSKDFTINRTDFGVKYGSASFFDNLKDKAISDDVGLTINLKAK